MGARMIGSVCGFQTHAPPGPIIAYSRAQKPRPTKSPTRARFLRALIPALCREPSAGNPKTPSQAPQQAPCRPPTAPSPLGPGFGTPMGSSNFEHGPVQPNRPGASWVEFPCGGQVCVGGWLCGWVAAWVGVGSWGSVRACVPVFALADPSDIFVF